MTSRKLASVGEKTFRDRSESPTKKVDEELVDVEEPPVQTKKTMDEQESVQFAPTTPIIT